MLMKSVVILRLEIPDLNHAIPHTLDYIWLYLSKSGLGLCLRINDWCFAWMSRTALSLTYLLITAMVCGYYFPIMYVR